jgi:hypothetical protein
VLGSMGVWRDGCLARWVFGPMFCIPFLFEIEPDEILVLERERAEDALFENRTIIPKGFTSPGLLPGQKAPACPPNN